MSALPKLDRRYRISVDEFMLLCAWLNAASHIRPIRHDMIGPLSAAYTLAGYFDPSSEMYGFPREKRWPVIEEALRSRPRALVKREAIGVVVALRASMACHDVPYLERFAGYSPERSASRQASSMSESTEAYTSSVIEARA